MALYFRQGMSISAIPTWLSSLNFTLMILVHHHTHPTPTLAPAPFHISYHTQMVIMDLERRAAGGIVKCSDRRKLILIWQKISHSSTGAFPNRERHLAWARQGDSKNGLNWGYELKGRFRGCNAAAVIAVCFLSYP